MNIFMLFLEMAPSVFKCIDTLYGCVELDGDPVEHQIWTWWTFRRQCSCAYLGDQSSENIFKKFHKLLVTKTDFLLLKYIAAAISLT